jgi:hypothetical protein
MALMSSTCAEVHVFVSLSVASKSINRICSGWKVIRMHPKSKAFLDNVPAATNVWFIGN